MVFGVMRVVNFAHGELVMIGAYTVWFTYQQHNVPFVLAVLLAVVIVVAIGALMEIFLFKPKRHDPLGGLICSLGVLFILQVGAHLIGGTGPSKQVVAPLRGITEFFGGMIRVADQKLFSVIVIAVVLYILWYFLTRTKFGWALRAMAMDREAAALQGININRTALIAICISAGLAGLAGGLIAPMININPYIGHNVIITSFIITIVGGIGSLTGAVSIAFVYALFHTFITAYWDGTVATLCGLVVMVIVLIFKPKGIMGK